MEEEGGDFPEEIEVEVEGEGDTAKERISADQEDEDIDSEEDELKPKPAFEIGVISEELQEEEREAIAYILSVRNQKQEILAGRGRKAKRSELSESKYEKKQFQNGSIVVEQMKLVESKQTQWALMKGWRDETVRNWKVVVANLQYLCKNKRNEDLIKQKLARNDLGGIPQAHRLCYNKWLQLPQIQQLLVELSNGRYEYLHNSQQGKISENGQNYHLWMYSLLALHQSYASYTNFQALASINACIQKQNEIMQKKVKNTTEQQLESYKNAIAQWMTTLVILIEVFNQRFLEKHVKILSLVGIL